MHHLYHFDEILIVIGNERYLFYFPLDAAKLRCRISVEFQIDILTNFYFARNNGESYGSGNAQILKVINTNGSVAFEVLPTMIDGNVRSMVEVDIPGSKSVIVVGKVSEELKNYEF